MEEGVLWRAYVMEEPCAVAWGKDNNTARSSLLGFLTPALLCNTRQQISNPLSSASALSSYRTVALALALVLYNTVQVVPQRCI
jgi:hypothetical protein